MMGFGLGLVLDSIYKEDRLERVFLARGAPKTLPQRPKSSHFLGIKIVGFGPEIPFRFTGPKHRAIVGGTRVFPTSIGTFRFNVRRLFASQGE